MKKSLTTVEFRGTKEQEEKLLAVIAELKDTQGAMMPILQKAQDIYGYLPADVLYHIAERIGSTPAKVMGVATFYSQFSLNPKGKYKISVCLGTACYVKGSGDLYNKLKEILSLEDGECTVEVLKTQDKWFGVTYKEDRPLVVNSIQEMKDKGLYPQNMLEWR